MPLSGKCIQVTPGDARLTDGPVSTLGTPMALFSAKTLPMGHSGAYTVCDRTQLVAGCDLRQDVLDKWAPFYNVDPSHCYTDYKEMLEKEKPDIVSICTQPEHRAAIAIYCAEHGVKAIYAEKGFTASVQEADAVVDACSKHGVILNLGTNRRYDKGFDAARQLIESGTCRSTDLVVDCSASFPCLNTLSHQIWEHARR